MVSYSTIQPKPTKGIQRKMGKSHRGHAKPLLEGCIHFSDFINFFFFLMVGMGGGAFWAQSNAAVAPHCGQILQRRKQKERSQPHETK